jgi:hypothetical protein
MRIKKTLSYLLNGTLRSALPVAGIALSAVLLTNHFENVSLASFNESNPEASAEEIYDELGITQRYIYGRACEIDTSQLESSLAEADVVACIQDRFADASEIGGATMTAPAAFLTVFCLKTMPRGMAYFNIAFKEAVNSDTRVLKEKDFAEMRAKNLADVTPPPPSNDVPPPPNVG